MNDIYPPPPCEHPQPLTLAVVIPCYNEEAILPLTARRLADKIAQLQSAGIISEKSKIVFVDDGSADGTWRLVENLHRENPRLFCGIKLSKNRGHQNALLCGLLTVKDAVDAAISIDADLQDDIDAIDEMLKQHSAGCEIVYGVRSDRQTDTYFKRTTAQIFYRLMRALGADLIDHHADFRLMSKRSLNALAEYSEVNLFLRGIVPMLGYKTGAAYYARASRSAGESKYPFGKMLNFALDGVTSLSTGMMRKITLLGFLLFLISVIAVVFYIIQGLLTDTVPGWSTIVVSLWGIGGMMLFSLGVVGEYVGKIYLETKHRPRYIIEQILDTDAGEL